MKPTKDDAPIPPQLEHEKAGQAVRASEVKYHPLSEGMHGVYQSSPNGKLLAVNPALVRMLGYDSEAELLTVDIRRELYVKPEDRDVWMQQLEKQGELRDFELVLKRKDGQEVTVLDSAHVVRDERDGILYYEGTLTDITQRKRMEGALRAGEERFKYRNE
jgi:PAS domain S-box-containing protein